MSVKIIIINKIERILICRALLRRALVDHISDRQYHVGREFRRVLCCDIVVSEPKFVERRSIITLEFYFAYCCKRCRRIVKDRTEILYECFKRAYRAPIRRRRAFIRCRNNV